VVAVILPTRREDGTLQARTGYLKRREIVAGNLSYTPRHIIEQAFEMLDTPYGWGGANGQQDCSQFVQEVFATVGIALPRNSSEQAQVGRLLGSSEPDDSDDKKQQAVVTQALPGVSLLHMRGHVMLYIGQVAGRPYAIHDVWAYREPIDDADTIRVINRVAVTSLHLGEGSRTGSLLHRLHSIRAIAFTRQNWRLAISCPLDLDTASVRSAQPARRRVGEIQVGKPLPLPCLLAQLCPCWHLPIPASPLRVESCECKRASSFWSAEGDDPDR